MADATRSFHPLRIATMQAMSKRIFSWGLMLLLVALVWYVRTYGLESVYTAYYPWKHAEAFAAAGTWVDVGTLSTGEGGVLVFDPSYLAPEASRDTTSSLYAGYALALPAAAGRTATVALELVDEGEEQPTVGAFAVRFIAGTLTPGPRLGEVGIDSGYITVSTPEAHQQRWQVGGPLSLSSLFVEWHNGAARREALTRSALTALDRGGFTLSRERDGFYRFEPPLSDAEIARADSLLQPIEGSVFVNVTQTQSMGDLMRLHRHSYVARLSDTEGVYAFGMKAGWGDGTYPCYALLHEGRLAGFECRFLDEFAASGFE